MKHKKKIQFKSLILGIVIGGIIFGSIGTLATTYVLQSSEIQYTNDKSVQQAIDELFVKAENCGTGSSETLPLGTANVVSYTITIPYTGNYPNIYCIYGTDANYGLVGNIQNNTCIIIGTDTDQALYYKIVGTDNSGKIYENTGSAITANTKPFNIINVGDYVYLKPTSTSYSITSDMTGCVSGAKLSNGKDACGGINGESQTINPSELTEWRVIRKNEDGTVDVVSDKVSSTKVYFYGRQGYQNLIGTLNSIASQYTDVNYVQSTRHMGFDGTATEYITNTSKLTSTSQPRFSSKDEPLGAGDNGYSTDYNLVNSVYGNLSAKNPSGIGAEYFLASRYYSWNIYCDSDDNCYDYWSFYNRRIDTKGNLTGSSLFGYDEYPPSSWDYNSPSLSIRPILTIKSNVKIIGGTGLLGDGYRLGL